MAFTYSRLIHFADTDAAGVVYFARYLSLCHEAYEESLAAAGIGLQVFSERERLFLPIRSSEADYLRPLRGGDAVRVTLTVAVEAADTFRTVYEVWREGTPAKVAARVRLQHVCIRIDGRDRAPLPPAFLAWAAAHAA